MKGDYSFRSTGLTVLGEGSRRICYRLSDPGLCAKFYRAPHQLRPGTSIRVRAVMRLARFSRWLNVNRQEWCYHSELSRRLPEELVSVFPDHVEPTFSADLGWGIVESLILNTDGTAARKVTQEMPRISDPALQLRVYRETERLLDAFAQHDVRFYDLSNLLLQWTGPNSFRLRIADFEPSCRGVPALLTGCSWYSRLKLRRRTTRYLARLRQDLFTPAAPQQAPAGLWSMWSRSYRLLARRVGLI